MVCKLLGDGSVVMVCKLPADRIDLQAWCVNYRHTIEKST